jgi:hypothetical protein
MTGHVFHPGHHALHGITVVLETTASELHVGRFDSQDDRGVHLIGVSSFDPRAANQSKADFLARTAKFGVRVDRPHLCIPNDRVVAVTPLGSFAP